MREIRRGRSGSEPDTARTALGLRTWLAAFGLLVCAIAVVVLGGFALDRAGSDRTLLTVLALLALLGGVIAAVDLVVIIRRRRGGRR